MNPKNPIILFDGKCILCDSFISFVVKHDKKQKFQLAYLQSKTAQKLSNELNFNITKNLDSVILIKDHKIHTKSSASLRILKDLNSLWSATIIFLIIPKPIRDYCYNFIGNRRYKWFGKKDQCNTNNQAIKDRLIK